MGVGGSRDGCCQPGFATDTRPLRTHAKSVPDAAMLPTSLLLMLFQTILTYNRKQHLHALPLDACFPCPRARRNRLLHRLFRAARNGQRCRQL